jgi:hypothetical protein
MTFTHYVGVDLGQSKDYTALAVVEEALWVPNDEVRWRLNLPTVGWLSPVGLQPAQVEQLRSLNFYGGRPEEPPLTVNWLERLPLGTSYPDAVARVGALLGTAPLRADVTALVVDQTGVGRPVVDLMRLQGLRPVAVTITAGTATAYDPDEDSYRTPKRDLVSVMAVLLEQRRLRVSAVLPEAATLRRELETFRRKVTPAGDDTYSSWREADHDDLVLAVALAVWYRQWWNAHIDRANARERKPA